MVGREPTRLRSVCVLPSLIREEGGSAVRRIILTVEGFRSLLMFHIEQFRCQECEALLWELFPEVEQNSDRLEEMAEVELRDLPPDILSEL